MAFCTKRFYFFAFEFAISFKKENKRLEKKSQNSNFRKKKFQFYQLSFDETVTATSKVLT